MWQMVTLKKGLWTSNRQIQPHSLINYCDMCMQNGTASLENWSFSYKSYIYVCIYIHIYITYMTQQLHSYRSEFYIHTNTCAQVFIAPLFKVFLLFLASGLCPPATASVISTPDRKQVRRHEEERVALLWSSKIFLRTVGSRLRHLIWLNLQVQGRLESILPYLVHCNSKQRKDSLGKKGRGVNMWIKSSTCHINLSSRDDGYHLTFILLGIYKCF